MPMTQKEMVKLLTANGWTKTKGGKGSHVKLEKASWAVIKTVLSLSLFWR